MFSSNSEKRSRTWHNKRCVCLCVRAMYFYIPVCVCVPQILYLIRCVFAGFDKTICSVAAQGNTNRSENTHSHTLLFLIFVFMSSHLSLICIHPPVFFSLSVTPLFCASSLSLVTLRLSNQPTPTNTGHVIFCWQATYSSYRDCMFVVFTSCFWIIIVPRNKTCFLFYSCLQ